MTKKSLYCGDVITLESDKSEFNLSFLYNCGVMPHWRSSMSILFTSLCSSWLHYLWACSDHVSCLGQWNISKCGKRRVFISLWILRLFPSEIYIPARDMREKHVDIQPQLASDYKHETPKKNSRIVPSQGTETWSLINNCYFKPQRLELVQQAATYN